MEKGRTGRVLFQIDALYFSFSAFYPARARVAFAFVVFTDRPHPELIKKCHERRLVFTVLPIGSTYCNQGIQVGLIRGGEVGCV